jgi:hypothetical protein
VRKKIAASIGLIALIVTAELAFDPESSVGPLRVGMTGEEVDRAFDQPQWHHYKNHQRTREEGLGYWLEPDWLGEGAEVVVSFDGEGRVTGWRKTKIDHQRLSWWQKLEYVTRRR